MRGANVGGRGTEGDLRDGGGCAVGVVRVLRKAVRMLGEVMLIGRGVSILAEVILCSMSLQASVSKPSRLDSPDQIPAHGISTKTDKA